MTTTVVSRLMRLISRSLGLHDEVGDGAELHPRAVRQRERHAREVLDRLAIGFAEREPHRDLAVRGAQLGQPVAAHRAGHGQRHVLGGETELRDLVAIDDHLHFLVAGARLGAHGLEAGDRRQALRDVERDLGQALGRVAGELQAEVAAARGGVVELEARLADDDLGHLLR